jgi:hypothetical protein
MRRDSYRPASVAIAYPNVAAENKGKMLSGEGGLAQQARARIVGCIGSGALIQKKKCQES